jgi:hypothetical protein
MNTLPLSAIGASLLIAISAFLSHYGYHITPNAASSNVGATIPIATSFYNDSLQSGITPTQTTLTLVSGKDSEGKSLSGQYSFVIDQGTAVQEIVSCTTVAGVSASGCTRGVDLTTGTTSVASLEQTHNRGATVQITTAPVVNIMANIFRGIESIPSLVFYDSTVASSSIVNPNQITDKAYVDYVGTSGCTNADSATRGCVQLATALKAASSTATGSTGASDVLWSQYATDTPQNCSTAGNGGCVIMSLLNGKLNQSWLDLTQPFAWSGLQTFSSGYIDNASSTHVSTTNFTGTATFNGASTFNGTATFVAAPVGIPAIIAQSSSSTYSSVTSSTTVLSITIPLADMGTSSTMRLQMQLGAPIRAASSPPDSCGFDVNIGTGSATTTLNEYPTSDARSGAGLATLWDTVISAVNSKEYVTGSYNVFNAGSGTFTYYNGVNDLVTQSTKGNLYISVDENAFTSGGASCGVISYLLSLN